MRIFAVGGRRRGNAARPDQAGLVDGVIHRHVAVADGEILADRVVDGAVERAKPLVIGIRQVEIHARGAVGIHLHAGNERSVELLVDEGIEQVGVGMQLAHHLAEVGIDHGFDAARQLAIVGQQNPHASAIRLETGDRHILALPADQAAVGELASAARKERRLGQHDPPRCGRRDLGVER
jgi:GNAT superfamily N-acetyltransferase